MAACKAARVGGIPKPAEFAAARSGRIPNTETSPTVLHILTLTSYIDISCSSSKMNNINTPSRKTSYRSNSGNRRRTLQQHLLPLRSGTSDSSNEVLQTAGQSCFHPLLNNPKQFSAHTT